MKIVLVSTYEMGHDPFGLASPRAWLEGAGHQVRVFDLAVERMEEEAIREAEMIAFYLPMHTATRLAAPVIERVKRMNPAARLVAYGLYAPLNEAMLRDLGVGAIAGGEFETSLVKLARGEAIEPVCLDRLRFIVPDRSDRDGQYAMLVSGGEKRRVAYTEASRGCKHLCRHCPIVPVYQGKFRVVDADVVLADIRQQVARGAAHVTFGDPDFFNGPAHAIRIVRALRQEFPRVSYDATIKIEHLLRHRKLLDTLRETGCAFIVSAAESLDDEVLARLEKNHTRRDFFEAVELTRAAGLTLQPTFIAFTPWTTIEGYCDFLRTIAELGLVENVAPVQLVLRLLVTPGSRLLQLPDLDVEPFDAKSLVYPWKHRDPAVDTLGSRAFQTVARLQKENRSRAEIFREIAALVSMPLENFDLAPRTASPYLNEPWYC